MTAKNNFIINHKISDSRPSDPVARVFLGLYFAEAVDEFLSNNFKGCIRVNRSKFDNESVLVCGDYVAYFFKLLLTSVYGRVLLNMDISSGNQELVMSIEAAEVLNIADSELRQIIKTARNAGMNIAISDRGMTLTLKYKDAQIHKVYAISPEDGKRYVAESFSEIFFLNH